MNIWNDTTHTHIFDGSVSTTFTPSILSNYGMDRAFYSLDTPIQLSMNILVAKSDLFSRCPLDIFIISRCRDTLKILGCCRSVRCRSSRHLYYNTLPNPIYFFGGGCVCRSGCVPLDNIIISRYKKYEFFGVVGVEKTIG